MTTGQHLLAAGDTAGQRLQSGVPGGGDQADGAVAGVVDAGSKEFSARSSRTSVGTACASPSSSVRRRGESAVVSGNASPPTIACDSGVICRWRPVWLSTPTEPASAPSRTVTRTLGANRRARAGRNLQPGEATSKARDHAARRRRRHRGAGRHARRRSSVPRRRSLRRSPGRGSPARRDPCAPVRTTSPRRRCRPSTAVTTTPFACTTLASTTPRNVVVAADSGLPQPVTDPATSSRRQPRPHLPAQATGGRLGAIAGGLPHVSMIRVVGLRLYGPL